MSHLAQVKRVSKSGGAQILLQPRPTIGRAAITVQIRANRLPQLHRDISYPGLGILMKYRTAPIVSASDLEQEANLTASTSFQFP
jgi:hypothetical protein